MRPQRARRYQLFADDGALAGMLRMQLSCLPRDDATRLSSGGAAVGLIAQLENRPLEGGRMQVRSAAPRQGYGRLGRGGADGGMRRSA